MRYSKYILLIVLTLQVTIISADDFSVYLQQCFNHLIHTEFGDDKEKRKLAGRAFGDMLSRTIKYKITGEQDELPLMLIILKECLKKNWSTTILNTPEKQNFLKNRLRLLNHLYNRETCKFPGSRPLEGDRKKVFYIVEWLLSYNFLPPIERNNYTIHKLTGDPLNHLYKRRTEQSEQNILKLQIEMSDYLRVIIMDKEMKRITQLRQKVQSGRTALLEFEQCASEIIVPEPDYTLQKAFNHLQYENLGLELNAPLQFIQDTGLWRLAKALLRNQWNWEAKKQYLHLFSLYVNVEKALEKQDMDWFTAWDYFFVGTSPLRLLRYRASAPTNEQHEQAIQPSPSANKQLPPYPSPPSYNHSKPQPKRPPYRTQRSLE